MAENAAMNLDWNDLQHFVTLVEQETLTARSAKIWKAIAADMARHAIARLLVTQHKSGQFA